MQFSFYKTADDAEGQLNTGISAAALSIPLKTGQGAQFPQPINGVATSLGTGTTLNDTGIGASGIAIGDFIENTTDGSHAWVTAVNTNDISTTQLIGGADNTWQNADAWYAKRFLVTLNQRDANGAITASEKVRISGRTTDTLTVLSGDRGFDGSVAQSFLADDHVSLFAVSQHFEGLQKAVSELAQDIKTLQDNRALQSTLDSTIANRKWKQPCRAATTGSITIATALNNGDTIDGVTLATGDRVLVKNQGTASENGIYIVGVSPARATDADGNDEIAGMTVVITEGTTNADTMWLCTTNDPVTVGSTSIAFVQIAADFAVVNAAVATAAAGTFAHTAGETISGGTTPKLVSVVPQSSASVIIDYLASGALDTGNIGGASGTQYGAAQEFTVPSNINKISQIRFPLKRAASTTGSFTITVRRGNPNSATVLKTEVVNVSSLGTSYGNYTLTISPAITVVPGEQLSICILGDGNAVLGDYCKWRGNNSSFYSGGNFWSDSDTGTYSESGLTNYDLAFDVTGYLSADYIFSTSASDSAKLGVLGFVEEDKALDESVTIITRGTLSGFSSLTPGSYVYASNTAGAISHTPGSTSIKIGRAISATQILIMLQ